MEAATLPFDQATYDRSIEVLRGQGFSQDDAEEATQTAFLEAWERCGDLDFGPGLIVNKAKLRAINLTQRADRRRNVSLDAAAEDDVDKAPVELAVDVVDFDSHVEVAKLGEHPVLLRRLEAVRNGASAHLQPRGSNSSRCLYDDATVERARRLRNAGRTLKEIAEATGATESTVQVWVTRQQRVCSTEGWSEDLAILAMKLFAEEEGRRPVWSDFRTDKRLPTYCPLERIFGKPNTLRRALEAAGFELTPADIHRPVYSDDDIVTLIREFEAREGRLPRYSDWGGDSGLPSQARLGKRFGTSKAQLILDQIEGGS